jgi:hypothetical protein|tara:strand:+ start:2890 stop:3045 length:156 start_codon:yes stop_codon:yes gene_type:complete
MKDNQRVHQIDLSRMTVDVNAPVSSFFRDSGGLLVGSTEELFWSFILVKSS